MKNTRNINIKKSCRSDSSFYFNRKYVSLMHLLWGLLLRVPQELLVSQERVLLS